MTRHFAGIAGAFLLLCASSAPAQDTPANPPTSQPQSQPEPPQRRVATDAMSAVMLGASWNFALSGFGGYDRGSLTDSTNALANSGADTTFIRGSSGGFSARLNGSKSRRKSSFTFGGGSTSMYYNSSNRLLTDFNASTTQSAKLGRSSSLSFAENFSYAPYYSLGLFPGIGVAGADAGAYQNFDLAVRRTQLFHYGASAGYAHPISDRTSLALNYSAEISSVGSSKPDSVYQQAGFRYLHTINRVFGYHLGYAYGLVDFLNNSQTGQSGQTAFHTIDVGIDLKKSLSLSRRTTFSFSTGSTLSRRAQATSLPGSGQTQFQFIGSADLSYNIGRSWNTGISYRRSWQVLDGTFEPFFNDAVAGGISGGLGRKVSVGASVGYILGARQGTNSQNHAAAASSYVNFTLARGMSGYVQVAYYQQRFDFTQSELTVPLDIRRNSVRGGLTMSLPRGR